MALFEDEEEIEVVVDEPNKYLDNPTLGVSLVKKMMNRYQGNGNAAALDSILDEKIFPILAELEVEDGLDIYKKYKRIINRLKEQRKIEMIEGKKILGIGGKFSAGKSCFINSITHASLPEEQRPTTSIATYIMNSKKKNNLAITGSNNLVNLDDEAVLALTHRFYEKYNMGFSKLIKNLVISSPDFLYPNIAILDTPGYSKSDDSKAEDASDAELAREQLKSVDYLIWLVDSVQGVVTQRDIEFISSLNIDTEILVVYTKGDCEEISNLEKKIETAKQVLESVDKDVYGIIAYDSMHGETIIGEGVLDEYLSMINEEECDQLGLVREMRVLQDEIMNQLENRLKDINSLRCKLEKILVNVLNVEHISSIIYEKQILTNEQEMIMKDRKLLEEYFEHMIDMLNGLGGVK